MIEEIIAVGIGGFAGTCGRYIISVVAKKLLGINFPIATFIANIAGCLILGIFLGIAQSHGLGKNTSLMLMTGFCGGFTTFSTFSHDSYTLLLKRRWSKLIIYISSTIVLGISALYIGTILFR